MRPEVHPTNSLMYLLALTVKLTHVLRLDNRPRALFIFELFKPAVEVLFALGIYLEKELVL